MFSFLYSCTEKRAVVPTIYLQRLLKVNNPHSSQSHLAHVLLFYAFISTNRKRASFDRVSVSGKHLNIYQTNSCTRRGHGQHKLLEAFLFAQRLCHLWATNGQYHKVASSLHMISLGYWLIL